MPNAERRMAGPSRRTCPQFAMRNSSFDIRPAPCTPSSRSSSTNSSTAATSQAASPASSSWCRMIYFRRRFNPSLPAQLWRVCELDAPEPGNTLAPVNANQDPVTVLREVAGSTCFCAGRTVKLAARYGCPHSPALRGVSICGIDSSRSLDFTTVKGADMLPTLLKGRPAKRCW